MRYRTCLYPAMVMMGLLLFMRCAAPEPYRQETRDFSQYLGSTFNRALTDTPATYILIPDNQCFNCVKSSIEQRITDSNLTSHNAYVVSNALPFKNWLSARLLLDLDNNINTLKWMEYSNVVIRTEKGKILQMHKESRTAGLDSLLQVLGF